MDHQGGGGVDVRPLSDEVPTKLFSGMFEKVSDLSPLFTCDLIKFCRNMNRYHIGRGN